MAKKAISKKAVPAAPAPRVKRERRKLPLVKHVYRALPIVKPVIVEKPAKKKNGK